MNKKLPQELISKLKLIYTSTELDTINDWYNTEKRDTTFRINTLKSDSKEIEWILNEKGIKFEKIDFLENAYKLIWWKEKDLWDLTIFKQWKIYVQWLSSQLPVLFLDLNADDTVLDITAAPWGKTSQIWTILDNSWEILAVDNNQIRIDKLEFTLKRQGVKNYQTLKIDARNFETDEYLDHFDNILFDAPCSSEWRFNLNIEKTYKFWNPVIVKRNYKLQKNILQKIIPTLKNWGTLVYSTCTLSPEENEAVAHFILSNFPEMKIVDITENIEIENKKTWITTFWDTVYRNDVCKSLRIIPNKEMEGFFVAKFKKEEL